MAERAGEVVVVIRADNSQLKANLSAANRFLQETKRNAEIIGRVKASPAVQLIDRVSAPLRQIQSQLGRLQKVYKVTVDVVDKARDKLRSILKAITSPLALLGAGAGVTGLIAWPLVVANEMERSRMAMEHFSGSVEAGRENFSRFVEYATKSPIYEIPLVMEMGKNFLALGKDVDFAIRGMDAFAAAAYWGNRSLADMALAFRGFMQIASKGTLQMEELYQVTENLGVPINWVTEELGVTSSQLRDLGRAGIDAATAMEVIIRAIEKHYPRPDWGRDLVAQLNQLKESARLLAWQFGAGLLPVVLRILNEITGALDPAGERFKSFGDRLRQFGETLGEKLWDSYQKAKEFFRGLAAEDMPLGDKIIVAIEKALEAVKSWMDGPGGKRVQEVFVKLGEIAARAWLAGLKGLLKGTISEAIHGNIVGMLAMAGGFMALGGGLILKGIGWLGRGAIGIGRRILSRGGAALTAEAAGEAATAAATLPRVASWLPRLAPGISRLAWPLAIAGGVYETFKASPERRLETGLRAGGMLAGGLAGAKLGAAAGTLIAPGIGTAIGGVVGGLVGGIIGSLAGRLAPAISAAWTRLREEWNQTKGALAEGWASVETSASEAWENIRSRASSAWRAVIEKLEELRAGLGRFLAHPMGYIGFWTGWVARQIVDATNAVASRFSSLPERMAVWWAGTWNTVTQWAANIYSSAVAWATNTVLAVEAWFSSLPGRAATWWANTWASVVNWAVSLYNSAVNWIGNTVQSIEYWFSTLPARAEAWWSSLWASVNNWAANIYSSIVGWFSSLPDRIFGWIDSIRTRLGLLKDEFAAGFRGGWAAAGPTPWQHGGIVTRPHLGLVGEAGPEAIIPLSSRMRGRALSLWAQVGQYLGVRPYAAGGIAGPVPAVAAPYGSVNVTVAGVTVNIAGGEIDEEALAMRIGWEIVGHIKRALQNRA